MLAEYVLADAVRAGSAFSVAAPVDETTCRALFVTDAEAGLPMFEDALSAACDGCLSLVRAAGATDGLRYLGSGRFDIAFVYLRGETGAAAALVRAAGGRLCRTPMVLMSATPGGDLETEALAAGAVDFLDASEASPALLRRIVRYAGFSHGMTRRLIVDGNRHKAVAKTASAASARKTRFLAEMSHELRTPLNAILGFSEAVRDEMFGPIEGVAAGKYREYLSDIHASGVHLLTLINDLLDLSKIEAGRMDLAPERVCLSDIAADIDRMTRPQAAAKGVNLSFGTSGAVQAVVFADRRQLTQALLNLVANAIRFTPAGGSVGLSARSEGENLVIAVSDTGCGIAAADLDRVLEPFGQAGGRAGDGTGLGLPLAGAIMALHRGGLEIASEPGEGTTVSVWLPAGASAL